MLMINNVVSYMCVGLTEAAPILSGCNVPLYAPNAMFTLNSAPPSALDTKTPSEDIEVPRKSIRN